MCLKHMCTYTEICVCIISDLSVVYVYVYVEDTYTISI